MSEDPRIVSRRPSRKDGISFSDPIMIRQGPNTHFEVLLQFISKREGTELTVKLKYWKKVRSGYRIGFPAEFTLNHKEATLLGQAIQDGIALADAGLREAFAAGFPEAWARIQARRRFMADALGIELHPDVLPFSNIPAYLPPFVLRPDRAMTVAG